MAKAEFKVTGMQQMQAKIRAAARKFPLEAGRALYVETEIEATECKRRTPVDTGALVNSEHVEGPEISAGQVSTKIVAGGPAAPYALIVHEDLDALHKVGQAKFIESTLNESAPSLAARVARRIDLNRIVE